MEIERDYIIYAYMSHDSTVEFGACNRTHILPPEDWKRDRKNAAKELA
jgi:hypothetical protein